MNKLELFQKIINKAKENGYEGPDGGDNLDFIIDDTNVYSIFFREDFAISLWGFEKGEISIGRGFSKRKKVIHKWEIILSKMVVSKDKWQFIKDNLDLDN